MSYTGAGLPALCFFVLINNIILDEKKQSGPEPDEPERDRSTLYIPRTRYYVPRCAP